MTTAASIRYETNTEGLRGFAALMVIFTHMLTPYPHVDPGYAASPVFWKIEAGQGAVLLFFVLSGYVIGLTNHRPFSIAAFGDYARRRGVRLLPLYLLAVGLAVIVGAATPWTTVLGHVFFLQNELPYGSLHFPLLASNTNLWSLNYEVLYYALFAFVWAGGRAWPFFVFGAAMMGALGWLLPHGGALIATYSAGWTFWLAGYGLAQAPKVNSDAPAHRLPWPSLLLLWLAVWHLKPMWWLSNRFGLLPEHGWMSYAFYDFIPACVALIMTVSGRRPRGSSLIIGSALVIPLAFVFWRLVRGRIFDESFWIDDALCMLALALWWWRPSANAFGRLAPVGAISYALYIFHSPLQELILRQNWLPSGTIATFVLRCVLILVLTATVSWLAERRLQPWLSNRLKPSKSV